ncbi:hypothetical protein VHEMI04438 [[Torrubiella] hemipterigena]|uniref:AB hydrolase-1 domain-containing protein n=1 Tax=[Torrubiella] hemipterigena TaxID=1531966 RepID=A0A0A1TE95_9HYPO|nr:hypothetical protein VHEMI04438 [[Torrubiella] hemipterigena]
MESKIQYFTAPAVTASEAPLPPLTISYKTVGNPSSPAILIPTCFGGKIEESLTFLWRQTGTEPPVLSNYYVVICGLLGGSESSSPSNAEQSIRGSKFPKVTYKDNIDLQYKLCRSLGIRSLVAYIGFSMGGQQAYHMGILYPDFAHRIIALATSARTSMHNKAIQTALRASIINSVDWCGGEYKTPCRQGTVAFGKVFTGWAFSTEWFDAEGWKALGFNTIEALFEDDEKNGLGSWDAHDLLCQLYTWEHGDISIHGPQPGNLKLALEQLKMPILLLPCRTDLFFPPAHSNSEVQYLARGTMTVLDSIWGHIAVGGFDLKPEEAFLQKQISDFLKK